MVLRTEPLVTVIIPTYNCASFISEAIESVLSQSFSQNEIEIIVIDDGSTDNTKEVLFKYQNKIKYIYSKNSGKAWTTKRGIDIAQGKYIFNLDADDVFLSDKIKKVVDIFEADRNIVHVAHPAIYWYVDKNIEKIESIPSNIKNVKMQGKDLLNYFYVRKMLFGGGSTFAGRSDALKKIVIKKDVDMYIDEYLLLFILKEGHSFFIDEPLSVWRIHSNNFSKVNCFLEKEERKIKSMKAVLCDVLNSDFNKKIKKLYILKMMVSELAIKENHNKKSIEDVFNLWLYILKNLGIFGFDVFKIIKKYTVLNRSLPSFMIKLFKKVREILEK